MVLRDNLETSTVRFFRRLYPSLLALKELNTQQMSEILGITDMAAVTHRNRLERSGYLIRIDYRKWKLNPQALQHPLLTAMLSYNVQVTKGDLENVQLPQAQT